ncbi:hypothetical protein [Mesorhizobium sp.]|uniref:hypothetical protein n=1 Tax=Mesorhizobium sp. TaxID=1871066 RepID=UPI000FE978DB|nr:hypothetical protein [Mesorhizobium sp.]RWP35099.1 MAG: hypothetical protein EOR03_14325 [Mesorhizobium sp.]
MSLTIAQIAGGARENFVKQLSIFAQRAEFLEQAASIAESAEKLLAAMLAQADACNRRQIPEAASPLPTNLSRSRFIGSRQKAAGTADGKSDTSPKRFTRPAKMADDLFPAPLSYCWTMIFFEKAFALCEVMLYF